MALPTTGTSALLGLLSGFIPDDFLNEVLPRHQGRGRRTQWSAAQLYRVLLLQLLTPARSCNLLCELLPEQRAWRRFAYLPNKRILPNARQLHEFRDRLTPAVLRSINEQLVLRLFDGLPKQQPAIALMDATDLPAATSAHKKSGLALTPRAKPRLAHAPSKPGRLAGLWATKNTPCDCGCHIINRR